MTATLGSLREGYRAMVFGSSGGIGAALVKALLADPRAAQVHAASRSGGEASAKCVPHAFALEDEASIAACFERAGEGGPLDLVIVATGLLHAEDGLRPEKTWRAIDAAALERAFGINTIGPALIARHALDHLATGHKAVFAALSARVGSIEDNRLGGWHAYRASKAALNMLVKTCAIELARRKPLAVCATLHPGTVDTALSKPFQSNVAAPSLFTPETSAAHLLGVIDRLGPANSGGLYAWDGSRIPF